MERDAQCTRSDMLMERIGSAYSLRFRQFHRVASAIVGDSDLGRDAVQEAFARAISRRLDYRGDGPLDAWLWRTVTNVARDYRRTANSSALPGEVPDRSDGSSGVEIDGFDSTIRKRVARLPERQRIALFLRYYVDLSYTEIAEVLEIRTGTVSATLNAAHKALRTDLAPALQREAATSAPLAAAA
jgi:RNA polymerase sigma-70 factor (ECF subfamily)